MSPPQPLDPTTRPPHPPTTLTLLSFSLRYLLALVTSLGVDPNEAPPAALDDDDQDDREVGLNAQGKWELASRDEAGE